MKTITREMAAQLKVGDVICPLPNWNISERKRKLPKMCVIVAIDSHEHSQSGVMVTVKSLTGALIRLDAGWFRA